jgi:hypothetical protein
MDPEENGSEPRSTPERESEESYWQWVALVVLLACWMAEASF